ncbi:hypothetical protein BGP76_04040 [Reichenbachiella sp. MSK19-1]|nr:hypothetical protein BGP76_04040 [Reichenbachiella sp. MSK19-1]
MTGGAGFSRDSQNSSRSNRSLLKGSGLYKSFDKSYISDYIISRKPRIFKEATPEYLAELHVKLAARRKKEIKRKIKAMVLSLLIVSLIVLWLFLS